MDNRKETPAHGLTIPHLAHLAFRIRDPRPTQAPTGGTRGSVLCLRACTRSWCRYVLGRVVSRGFNQLAVHGGSRPRDSELRGLNLAHLLTTINVEPPRTNPRS
jgi:hypothetical protein